MRLRNIFQKDYRDIVAVYPHENDIYMAGLGSYRDGRIALMWTDTLPDNGEGFRDRLLGRLMIQQRRNSEIIFCIDDDRVITTEREMPGVTSEEVEQAIRLEMEYSGEDCKWTYKYQDDVVTLKKISGDDYNKVVELYREDLLISGVMVLEHCGTTGDPINDDLICTVSAYIEGEGYCFERLPNRLFNRDWFKIGSLFFLANICVSLMIVGGAFFECQELNEKIHGYKQQMALLENVNDMKKETESMTGEIKDKAKILNSLRNKGMGISGYAIMVDLCHVPREGVILTEARVDKDKQMILKGRADNVGDLIKYTGQLGHELSIDKTQQGEQGNVEFICKGQL